MDFKKTMNKAIKTCDSSANISRDEIKEIFNLLSNALMYNADSKKWMPFVEKAQSRLLSISVRLK